MNFHLSENLEATTFFKRLSSTLLGSHCCHLWWGATNDHLICVLLPQVPDLFCSNFILPHKSACLLSFALVGKDVVVREYIEASRKDFGP